MCIGYNTVMDTAYSGDSGNWRFSGYGDSGCWIHWMQRILDKVDMEVDTVDTVDTADTVDTVDTMDTVDTVNTVDTLDTMDTVE